MTKGVSVVINVSENSGRKSKKKPEKPGKTGLAGKLLGLLARIWVKSHD